MPNSPHSSTDEAEKKRLEYERQELKKVLGLLRSQLVSDDWVDDMLNPSEIMAIRRELYTELHRLREIKAKLIRSETRTPSDDEVAELFGAFHHWFDDE